MGWIRDAIDRCDRSGMLDQVC